MIRKVVVIGPESTGKSTLCKQLAEHFKTKWVPEYARAYLETHGTKYGFEDLYKIAEGQIQHEDDVLNSQFPIPNSQLLFIDTDMYVIKVWSEYVFNKCDNRILTHIAKRNYDLYLLCNTDLPWVEDALREYPELYQREKLFHFYKDAMINQQVPFTEIKGNYEQRLELAIKAVEAIL